MTCSALGARRGQEPWRDVSPCTGTRRPLLKNSTVNRQRHRRQRRSHRQPTQLLAFHPAGAAEAHHHRPDRRHERGEDDERVDRSDGEQQTGHGVDAERVFETRVLRRQRVRIDREQQHQQQRRGSRHPGPPAPARGGQRAGRGEQQHEAAAGQQGGFEAVGDPSQVAGGRHRPQPGHHPVEDVLGDEGVGRRQQPDAEQQPAHRVRWASAGQHRSDRGGAHRRRQQGGTAGLQHAQLWPAALAQQVVQPGGNGQAEHGQHPQRPRQRGRRPAGPRWSGGQGHRHRPRCAQHTTSTSPS